MDVSAPISSSAVPAWLRLLLAPISAAIVLLGIWVTGGKLTNDFEASMTFTALWFLVVLVVAMIVWRRAPSLRVPVSVVAVATFVLVGGYLGLASTRDVKVDETVVSGSASLTGAFVDVAHATEGTARVVETPAGDRALTLTGFRTDPGPDLYVYVGLGHTSGGDVGGAARIARLKGNVGDQQYALPPDLDLAGGATVVIWCRAFSVPFGAAQLGPS